MLNQNKKRPQDISIEIIKEYTKKAEKKRTNVPIKDFGNMEEFQTNVDLKDMFSMIRTNFSVIFSVMNDRFDETINKIDDLSDRVSNIEEKVSDLEELVMLENVSSCSESSHISYYLDSDDDLCEVNKSNSIKEEDEKKEGTLDNIDKNFSQKDEKGSS